MMILMMMKIICMITMLMMIHEDNDDDDDDDNDDNDDDICLDAGFCAISRQLCGALEAPYTEVSPRERQ